MLLLVLTAISILITTTNSVVCPSYKYYDTGSSSCLSCSYSCLSCTSTSDCTACDSTNDHRVLINQKACLCSKGYYDDRVSTVCKTCTSRIANCADCFYNSTYLPADAASGALQQGCFECSSGYVLIGNACNQYATCSAGQGPNATTNVCEACSTGCLTCRPSNTCTACDTAHNYFLVSGQITCTLCTLFGCTSCTSLTQCQTCSAGLILQNGACNCPSGQYFDPTSNACKNCSIFCVTCSGPSSYECTSCNTSQNRIMVGQDCQCDHYNYVESTTGAQCQKVNTALCERGYILIQTTNTCKEICGDGWRIQYDCDDGNLINTDGCSDACGIQTGFVCLNQGFAASICRLHTQVQFSNIVVTKDDKSNTLYFKMDLTPKSVVYNNYDLTNILHFRGGLLDLADAKYQDGTLKLTGTYNRDLDGKDIQLQIKQDNLFDANYPQNYQTLYNTTKATFTLSSFKIASNTSNNLKPNYYSDDIYQQAARTSKAALALMIVTMIILFGSLVIKNSLSLVINVNAIQIAYISMVTIRGLHPVTASLLQMRPVLGYSNLNLFQLSSQQVSVRVAALGFVQDFANNFNIMFFIQCAFLAGFVLTYLAAHKKPMIKLASKFMQRQALLLIIFNLPTVFFTATLMLDVFMLNIAFVAAASAVILYQLIHLLFYGKTYFAFTQVFDFSDKGHFKKFIIVYFMARLGSCLSFSFISVQPLKSLIAGAAFQGAFIIFLSFVRPFYHSLNNIFMIIIQILCIGFFGCIYATEAVTSLTADQRAKCIDVMIFIIGGMVVLAVANLIYSLVIDIKQYGKKLKAFNELVQAKENRVKN